MGEAFRIFNNPIPEKDLKKAEKNKDKYIRKFGDDSEMPYHLALEDTPVVWSLWNMQSLALSNEPTAEFTDKTVIIGNIRMGFGHYRISMAMASAAYALGYKPVWMDLNSFGESTCGKVIRHQNDLYSMGSRWSQKYELFNKFVWDPLNSEGFRKLSYNVSDEKVTELMTPVYRDIPRDTPLIAAHVWPAQAAVHAGMTHVVNAIPDNWPMALHLADGAVHTVQTPSAYLGYRTLRGMRKGQVLAPMPADALYETGHYIDHEIVSNIEADCARREKRLKNGGPVRYLLTIGGAGAQAELYLFIIRTLLPQVKKGKAVLLLNVGDHLDAWEYIRDKLGPDAQQIKEHFANMGEVMSFAKNALDGELSGLHAFYDPDIYAAVYTTNVLMRACDILVTKPGELSFYPVPKLMIQHVGGHEVWGAIRAAELGDGTYECAQPEDVDAMLRIIQSEPDIVLRLCEHIKAANKLGNYNGAYRVVRLACEGRME